MPQIVSWSRGLRGRLLLLTILPIIVLGAICFVAIRNIETLSKDLVFAGEVRAPKLRALGEMDSARNAIFRWLWAVYQEDESNIAGRNKNLGHVKEEIERFEAALKSFEKGARLETEIKLIAKVDEEWKQLKPMFLEAASMLAKHTKQDNHKAQKYIVDDLRPLATQVRETFDELRGFSEERIKQSIVEIQKETHEIKAFMTIFALGSAIALLILSLYVASRTANNLAAITSQISDAGIQVSSASVQLSSSSQQLSSGATEAAESLEETVSSLEELSSMVRLNADHAREASGLSQTSRKSAEEGEAEIKGLIQAMNEISGSSKKIEEIINVIDDIAFQTNILALNAAVEAARAGDQGKGFAVVAEAVRTLAQRSGAAAKEITTLIKDSTEKVGRGAEMATRSGTVLNVIVGSIRKVSDLNNEIATASREQSTGLEQISKAMNQLDQATQSNAAASEQVSAAAEEMSAQSGLLKDQVERLSEIIEGAQNPASKQPPARQSAAAPAASHPRKASGPSKGTHAANGSNGHGDNVYAFRSRKGQVVPLQANSRSPMSKEEVERLFPMEDEVTNGKASGDV